MKPGDMEEAFRTGLLKDEYFQLQKVVEDYDSRALTIKAWSVTFSAAAIVAAYVQGEAMLLPVAALSAFTFWLIEALWKTNQQAYYPRIWAIERHFRDSGTERASEIRPFAIGLTWSESFKAKGKYLRAWLIMIWPHVALPHVVIVAAALVLFSEWPPAAR